LLGRELVGERPAGGAGGGAEVLLEVESVELEDDPVYVVLEVGSFLAPAVQERLGLLHAPEAGVEGVDAEAALCEPFEHLTLRGDAELGGPPYRVEEDFEVAAGRGARIDLAERARGGVAGVHERRLAQLLPLGIDAGELLLG